MRADRRRRIIRKAIGAQAAWLHLLMRRRVVRYREDQTVLARRYNLVGREPELFSEDTRVRIVRLANACREPWQFAWTSGTVGEPKQLFYPQSRARVLQRAFLKQVLLACDAVGIDRLAAYFLTNLVPDRSLSGLLARQRPPWLLEKIALAGSIGHLPQAAALAGRFSHDAIHLTLLVLASPALIAMVNPSSLSVLLDRLRQDWDRIRDDARGILGTDLLPAVQQRLGRAMPEREARLRGLLKHPYCPAVRELLPDVWVVYCWSGGYVQPFIDRIGEQLAEVRPVFFPLFSLSTETVAYEIFPRVTTGGGLPIYPGVCYEFLPVDAAPTASSLRKPWDLDVGHAYEMVVSDAYGLVRYRTEDAFECLAFEQAAPVLRFMGRGGLTYSFTGEKITAAQLQEVYERVRRERGMAGAVFTCFPRLNRGGIPGYVFVGCPSARGALPAGLSAGDFDRHLMEINSEYAAKRRSGRLSRPAAVVEPYETLVARLMASDHRYDGSNPHQFKLLPLYQLFWESLNPQAVR